MTLALTLNAPIATKVVCFSRLKMFKKPLWQTVWTQIRLLLCSGSTLFASILNSSVMLGNYLQQTTFSDAFCSWRFKGQYGKISQDKCGLHREVTHFLVPLKYIGMFPSSSKIKKNVSSCACSATLSFFPFSPQMFVFKLCCFLVHLK